MAAMRHTFLGDRLTLLVFGSAVTPADTVAFMRRCFQVPAYDLYGATESMCIAMDGRINRQIIEEFKLVDVPALGYTSADKPFPRGELYIKSRWRIPGYYRNEAATAALSDSDAFMPTGDIMELRGKDRVAYVDRARNVLKLSQGEYVATAKLEAMYTNGSALLAQMFVYGRSEHSYLLAVVVPRMDALRAQLGDTGAGSSSIPPDRVKSLLLAEMQRIGASLHLAGWEMPRDILVEPEPFSKANGLLTDSDKLARSRLLHKYQPRLLQMFADIEQRAHRALLRQQAQAVTGSLNVSDLVTSSIASVLGCEVGTDDASQALSFVRMGGDSLTAVRLQQMLNYTCGVAPPVALLLDENTSIAALVEHMEAAREQREHKLAGARWRPPFSQVNGEEPRVARANDLKLTHFFEEQTLQQARELPLRPQPDHVLLTGANGFLGRFLLLELLQHGQRGRGGSGSRSSSSGDIAPLGAVTVIVRAQNDAAALARLISAYGQLAPLFQSLASDGRLEVLAGDLMRPQFGLSSDAYDRLCSVVDTVLHNGALVNHALSYEDLWEPNVLGTAEIMRFAIQGQRKAITFLSSVAVTAGAKGAGRDGSVLESQSGAQLWAERRLSDEYASGYATSKWACEVLLQQLAEEAALPVAVIRSSMVLAHTDPAMPGQINKTDYITRLFASLVHTAVRPDTFYTPKGGKAAGDASEAEEKRSDDMSSGTSSAESASVSTSAPRPHFDGVPVDVSSAGITAVCLTTRAPGVHGFHACNAHFHDGVSLDSLVDWIASAGYELHTLRPYAHWFDEFAQRLAALKPRELRDATSFPILFQWENPIDPAAEARMDNQRFRTTLSAHTRFDDVPVLDEAFMRTFLGHMRTAGSIGSPNTEAKPTR